MYCTRIIVVLLVALICSCSKEKKESQKIFELLDASSTGIDFSNDVTYTDDFNVYKYRNFYNGGGVSIGDINNDGLPDIYLTSNQNENRLYLNQGNFTFKDITEKAGVKGTKPWSTGVTMVDIDADGYLDIYVCNSGDINGENKQNELFINNGDLTFSEKAAAYNLGDKGFSTHASFFDYDKDGDLDVYILNNSYQAIGSFDLRRHERPKRDLLGGDKLMENVNGKFVDVSEKAGIYGSVIGFGLGVTVGDVNNDGWEDIYVSNDFFERDYLYINNHDGTFSEQFENQINSSSGASMGADMADINNDGHNDIFVTEMLPSEYQRLKTVTTFEDWNRYQLKVDNGYHHQFTRNTLQLNNGNDTFSEIGRLSGVEASDWSWGALVFDMDNDGWKDLFISNGMFKDLTNQDYLQYISNEEIIRSILSNNKVDYKRLVEIIPSNKVKNHAYKNLGDLKFKSFKSSGLLEESFSNGSAYGDLDNDGDLDLVVNNLNMKAFVYKNNTIEKGKGNFLKFNLKGQGKNSFAIGTKIKIEPHNLVIENQPTRGFQSSVDPRPNFGLNSNIAVNVEVIWPDGKITELENIDVNQTITLDQKEGVHSTIDSLANGTTLFQRDTNVLTHMHKENNFVDFHRDRLLNHMSSSEGPKMSEGDFNNDGLIDVFIGGSKGSEPSLYLKNKDGYSLKSIPDFKRNINSEDASSLVFDADGDGDQDLYVCSGGIEFSQHSTDFYDRLYLNDGMGNLTVSNQKLPNPGSTISSSIVIASDIDQDGDQDLFVGERAIPLKYGIPGSGFLLKNDGKGHFTNVTSSVAADLNNIGMITDADFQDLDNDGDKDLVIVGEFMGIEIFINQNGVFNKKANNVLSNYKGWWNNIHFADLDNDGDHDIILANHGQNSRFRASEENPITLYSKDFDQNGFTDPVLTFKSDNGKDYPYSLRHHLIDQIKSLKKKFPNYESFKDAGIKEIFTEEQLNNANILAANTLSSLILINEGDFNFKKQELPIETQFSTLYAIETHDFDSDGDLDIVMGGNLYRVKPEVGRYDASYGVYLENLGDMNFKNHTGGNGFQVDGEIRDFIVDKNRLIVSVNNDSIAVFKF